MPPISYNVLVSWGFF